MSAKVAWKRLAVGIVASACLSQARAEEPVAPLADRQQGGDEVAVAARPEAAPGAELWKPVVRLGTFADVRPKLKLKARFDYGDILRTEDRTAYATGSDSYLDKVKFGVGGRLLTRGKYGVAFEAKHIGEDRESAEVELDSAYVHYEFTDALAVRVGQTTLPLSRGSLLSSNDVLLEDARVVGSVGQVFSGSTQLQVQLRGDVWGGMVAYYAALAGGWSRGDTLRDADVGGVVGRGAPLLVARAELALPGFTQRLDEGEPGRGRRLSVGLSFARQSSIQYARASGHEDRRLFSADFTARVGPFSAVLEADTWRVDSTLPAVDGAKPWGGYAQTAWYIEALRLEPALRYDRLQESGDPAARQDTLTLGLTWYLRGDSAKLAVNWMHRSLGARSISRLENASRRDLLQVGGELSF